MSALDQLPAHWRDRIQIGPIPPGLDTPCWIWTGSGNGDGYGQASYQGKQQFVHRVAYTIIVGPIPDGLQIDHLCRVRHCLNPQHLEPVTSLENSLRSDRATRTRCIRNHPLSGHNLIIKKSGARGRRECRTCALAATHRSAERRKARRQAVSS